ncbi:hypothetical protein NLG97_g3646 [Lecanicillium saksenae]|uniref:Uncharacterized protein n=1 Tax=Lecanicillium saksenae TaxID=468837 RepID=A0ACC1R1G6_9HYPO|nr:hypothetical protein NLG97_g3646 [Lecanicillium saksenae]
MVVTGGESPALKAPYVLSPLGPKAITALTFITLAFCVICILARLYTRFRVIRQPWWDDLCIALAFVCAIAQSALTQIMVDTGLGEHFQNVDMTGLGRYFKAAYLSLAFFPLSVGFIKAALLLQFLRLFDPQGSAYKITIGLLVLDFLWMSAFGFISWASCFPVQKAWHPEIPGHCYGLGAAATNFSEFLATLLVHASSNFAIDVCILVLAAYMMWKMGAEKPNLRLRLCALLLVGLAANASALCRLIYLAAEFVQIRREAVKPDPTWSMAGGMTLLNIEVNLAAICASVPIFWEPMRQIIVDRFSEILVTREVTIDFRRRDKATTDAEERSLTELTKAGSGFSSFDDGTELAEVNAVPRHQPSHYDDEFIQSYVDPLRTASSNMAVSSTSSHAQRGM